ncbi:MAG: uracil-DNA glycosylase [Vampirovibrionales bacterium]|nr:uracil-DNA glycosylase [Vampirovibrionales bacterium]
MTHNPSTPVDHHSGESLTAWQQRFNQALTNCHLCPRLVSWREQVANKQVHIAKRHAEETYWGKPVPTFGDANGRVFILGLAPAAHGANRTGRMFTGDRSGEWLYRALHKAGFANQPTSTDANDGLALSDAIISAVCHCAPPENKPSKEEIAHCRPFLHQELEAYRQIRVVIALGKLAFESALSALKQGSGFDIPKPKPVFGHGLYYPLSHSDSGKTIILIGSYHPSQQNTFTGKLSEPMFDSIFTLAKSYL